MILDIRKIIPISGFVDSSQQFNPDQVKSLLEICQKCNGWDPQIEHCKLCASGPSKLWLKTSRCKLSKWPSWASWNATQLTP